MEQVMIILRERRNVHILKREIIKTQIKKKSSYDRPRLPLERVPVFSSCLNTYFLITKRFPHGNFFLFFFSHQENQNIVYLCGNNRIHRKILQTVNTEENVGIPFSRIFKFHKLQTYPNKCLCSIFKTYR